MDDQFEVETEVFDVASGWESFGKALHISPQRLSIIKAVPGITPEKCLSDTLSEFLRKNYKWEKFGEPSWRLIVTAIAHRAGGDDPALALRIARNHPTSNPGEFSLSVSNVGIVFTHVTGSL